MANVCGITSKNTITVEGNKSIGGSVTIWDANQPNKLVRLDNTGKIPTN